MKQQARGFSVVYFGCRGIGCSMKNSHAKQLARFSSRKALAEAKLGRALRYGTVQQRNFPVTSKLIGAALLAFRRKHSYLINGGNGVLF